LKLWDPTRPEEQRGQPENKAIARGEIGSPLSGTIADQQLMFEEQRLRGEGADATGTKEVR